MKTILATFAVVSMGLVVGCASAASPTDDASADAAQARLDDAMTHLTVGPDGRATFPLGELGYTPVEAETTEGALSGLDPSKGPHELAPPGGPVTCAGDQDHGGRICCDNTHCCINIGGTINCNLGPPRRFQIANVGNLTTNALDVGSN